MRTMSKPRNRLIFGPEIWSLQEKGGISRYFEKIIITLKNRVDTLLDYELLVWAEDDSLNSSLEVLSSKVQVSRPDFGSISQQDIYHSTFFNYANLNLARTNGAKTCLTIYDMIPERLGSNRRVRFWKDEKRRCFKSADAVIAISSTTARDVLRYYKSKNVILKTIYLGTDLYLSLDESTKPLISGDYFVFVGNRAGYKNFQCVVRAIRKSNFRVVCVGGGPFDERELALQKSLSVETQFIQMEANDAILANLLYYSCGLICTSQYEGFSLPILESVSCGSPVICSDIPVHRELYESVAHFFNPGSEGQLAEILSTFTSKFRIDASLVEQYRSSFTWDKTAQFHLEFYDEILKNDAIP